MKVAYVNGCYVPQPDAVVHIEDRGFQFADAVYEVWAVLDGKLTDAEGHFARLERSLGELSISAPRSRPALLAVLRETVRRNHVRNGIVYLQISRGTAPRDHAFPSADTPPTVVVTAKSLDLGKLEASATKGVSVVTRPDQRWGRCDIKTVGLLPNALAKQSAHQAGAYEAWLVDVEGRVTEGASTNAWIVDAGGRLRTRETAANILRGITRGNLISLASGLKMSVDERPFTVEEAKGAREAFLTAASAFLTPVVRIDEALVGDGRPGPVTLRLRALYLDHARRNAV